MRILPLMFVAGLTVSSSLFAQELPSNARAYLDRIQELTGAPIRMVSVGTRRSQIIHVS